MFIESKVYFNLGPQVPTWADGTDEEIVEALTRHYNDEIDLNDYWTVGDERVVHLSAIEATSDYGDLPEQDITLILVNSGGRTLTTPISNHTECAFVVGQKDCLSRTGRFQNGNYPYNGWGNSIIRDWLNRFYIYALPASLRSIFKSHVIPYCTTCTATIIATDNSIIGLPARKEIQGTDATVDKASSSYNQLTYYQDSSNRIKKVSGTANAYWTNSKYYYTKDYSSDLKKYIYFVAAEGGIYLDKSTTLQGIAPQMVI